MKPIRVFLMAEAATLSILVALFCLGDDTYFHKYLEVVFGFPSSSAGVYGSYAKELTPHTSTFHDIQSVTGDVLCLTLIFRALYRQHDPSAGHAALLAILVDHGGFALACWRQWGWIQPVFQGGALAVVALYLWITGANMEKDSRGAKKMKK